MAKGGFYGERELKGQSEYGSDCVYIGPWLFCRSGTVLCNWCPGLAGLELGFPVMNRGLTEGF